MAYILVYAYAVSDINKPLWRHLFPTRSTPMMPGVPHFGEVRTGSCCGFRIVQGPGNNNANSIPAGMIRAGYEVDPTTLCAYTEPCPHTNCDASAPYMYAIIKAFASDLLMFYGFEMTTDEPMKDPMYVITTYGWKTILNNPASIGADHWKQVLTEDRFWPTNRNRAIPAGSLFTPPTVARYLPSRLEILQGVLDEVDRNQAPRPRVERDMFGNRRNPPANLMAQAEDFDSGEDEDEDGNDDVQPLRPINPEPPAELPEIVEQPPLIVLQPVVEPQVVQIPAVVLPAAQPPNQPAEEGVDVAGRGGNNDDETNRHRVRIWSHAFADNANQIPMVYMRRRARPSLLRPQPVDMDINFPLRGDGPRVLEGIIQAFHLHGDLSDIQNIRRILEESRRTLTLRGRNRRVARRLNFR
ncbi:unnamed protein product [Orchesella dallaii]|uniref:Uncharacterized protein n=1 Tax=Orchesella dallaii TaxID=48710 RepID=A0ABP1RL73_9HEXA